MRFALWLPIGLVVGVTSCTPRQPSNDGADMTSTSSMGGQGTTGGAADATSGSPDSQGCSMADECGADEYCVGGYDPATGMMLEGRCVRDCTPADDLTRWCFDDSSCCEGLSCNPTDGFCNPVLTETGTGGSASGETGSNDGGGSTSGFGTGAGTGGGTETGDSSPGSSGTGTPAGSSGGSSMG